MAIREFRFLRGASALVFLLVLLSPVGAQQVATGSGPVVQGVVTEEQSGIPLATGSVSLYGEDREELLSVITDDQGRYALRAPAPGAYHLRAERIGYHPQEAGPFTLQATDTLTLDFQLSPSPLLLDSILVMVRRRGQPLRAGEQLVYGRLLDNESGDPIPQGLIRLVRETGSAASTTLSEGDGFFWLVSPSAGAYRLQAERIGYKTSEGPEFHLMLGDTIGLDFYLSMEAILLNPIVVTATARPFEDRYGLTGMGGFLRRYSANSRSGFGEFMTRDSIAEYEDWVLSTGHMLALTTMSVWASNSRSGTVTLRGRCQPRYYLDGMQLPPEYPLWALTPDQLEAVEVYVRPTIPAEFLQGFPCGVVALWYRRSADPRPGVPTWKRWLVGIGLLGLVLTISFSM